MVFMPTTASGALELYCSPPAEGFQMVAMMSNLFHFRSSTQSLLRIMHLSLHAIITSANKDQRPSFPGSREFSKRKVVNQDEITIVIMMALE